MGNSLDDYRTGVALYFERKKNERKKFGVQRFRCFTRKHFYLQFSKAIVCDNYYENMQMNHLWPTQMNLYQSYIPDLIV